MGRIMGAVNSRVPGLFNEMQAMRGSEKLMMKRLGMTEGGGLNMGPIAMAHLDAFAGRLGMAMHFETIGTPLPAEGGVVVRIFTNVDLMEDRIPKEMVEMLPRARTLSQGSWSVEDQFLYSVIPTDTRAMTVTFAAFRRSFAVLAVASMDAGQVSEAGTRIFRPGDLAARPPLSVSSGQLRQRIRPRWHRGL